MSIVFAKPDASVVVRGKEAEVVGSPKTAVKLLVDFLTSPEWEKAQSE